MTYRCLTTVSSYASCIYFTSLRKWPCYRNCLKVCFYQLFFWHMDSPIDMEWFLNRSIWPVVRTLTSIIILDQSWPGSNGNEKVLHTHQLSKTDASLSNALKCHTQDSFLCWKGCVNISLLMELHHYHRWSEAEDTPTRSLQIVLVSSYLICHNTILYQQNTYPAATKQRRFL